MFVFKTHEATRGVVNFTSRALYFTIVELAPEVGVAVSQELGPSINNNLIGLFANSL
jgi:hypothetical protein